LRHGVIESFRTRFPAESKKTIVSGTSVFFIQKPPVVVFGNTKSIPSRGTRLRCMSPRLRCAGVFASSGRIVAPSIRKAAFAFSDAPAPPARASTATSAPAATRRREQFTAGRVGDRLSTVRDTAIEPVAWNRPVVVDPDEAKRLLALDDETVFEPSPDVTSFFAELLAALSAHQPSQPIPPD
jgi:hypothetical protein